MGLASVTDRFTDTRAPRLWLLAHLELEHGIPARHIRHLHSDQLAQLCADDQAQDLEDSRPEAHNG